MVIAKSLKKVTLNLPAGLLKEAQLITGDGITATVLEGLKELTKKKLRSQLLKLRGKVDFKLDLDRTRR